MLWIFAIWLLSFPLRNIHLYAQFSVDNLLVPVLFACWCCNQLVGSRRTSVRQFLFIIFVSIFFLLFGLFNYRLIQGGIPLSIATWSMFRDMSYFLLPLLFVTHLRAALVASSCIVWVAAAGAVSALLTSLGLLHLDYIRYEDSRLGLDWLPKATGVFTNFGDMAALAAFALLLLFSGVRDQLALGLNTRPGRFIVYGCLSLGLVGSQSRNYLLSCLLALWLLFLFNRLTRRDRYAPQRVLFNLLLWSPAVIVIMIPFFGIVIDTLTVMGGSGAAKNALVRLTSYQESLAFLRGDIWTGVNYQSIRAVALAEGVHNLWLGVLLRGGVLGLLAIVVLWTTLIYRAYCALPYARERPLVVPGIVFIAILLFASLFYGALSLIFWMLLGMAMAIFNLRQPHPVPESVAVHRPWQSGSRPGVALPGRRGV